MPTDNRYTTSQVISFLRFPLCVLVVIQHSNLVFGIKKQGVIEFIQDENAIRTITLFSHIIAQIAVPVFFLISGYLFFVNIDRLNFVTWKNKISSRIKTMVIPYLLWSFLATMLGVVKRTTLMSQLFSQNSDNCDRNLFDFVSDAYVIDRGGLFFANVPQTPIDGPLWFIRDLFIMMFLTPLFSVFPKLTKCLILIFLFIIWAFDIIPCFIFPGVSIMGLLFFFLGCVWGENKYKIEDLTHTKLLLWICIILYLLFCTCDVLTVNFIHDIDVMHIEHILPIHNIGIAVGVALIIIISRFIPEWLLIKVSRFHTSTFFIFALHNLINWSLLSLILKFYYVNVQSYSNVIMLYIIWIAITVIVSFMFFKLSRVNNTLYYLLNGK